MADRLYQINVAYVPREDRLLLRATTRGGDEYRVWVTRRFAALLLGILTKRMDGFGGAPQLAAQQETRTLFRQGAMEKPFEGGAGRYPLGEAGILAFRANAGPVAGENFALELLPEQGQGVTLNLNRTLLYLFYNVLTQGIAQAQWNLPETAEASARVH
jgi:hypothetical protein